MNLPVEQLLEAKGHDLGLELLTPVGPRNPSISVSDINRPGLALAGFLENFLNERLQIFGQTEVSYLGTLTQAQRDKSCERLLSLPVPAIVVTKGLPVPARMRQVAREQGVPILRTAMSTTPFIHLLASYLDDIFAPTTTLHGSLVDVYGVGMLFIGKSGIGKSETALDLVERGHRLVADDAVKVTRRYGNILLGAGNQILRHNMEIRGIGIIDVERIFGIRAVRETKRIEVQVNLEEWDPHKAYERLGLDDATTTMLGVSIPVVTIPIFPGKNITVISEVVALNYLVKVAGYHPARMLEERQRAMMNNPERQRAHVYEDPE